VTTNRKKNWPFNLKKVTQLIPYWSNSCHWLIPIHCTDTLHCDVGLMSFSTTHTLVTTHTHTHTHTHAHLTALCPGLPGWAGTKKVKPIWILLEQETVSGSGISWDIRKTATRSRQITMPAPPCSVFYRPDALPAPPPQPTVSKHWRQLLNKLQLSICVFGYILQITSVVHIQQSVSCVCQ